VEKGVDWLKKQQQPDGRWVGGPVIGYTAFVSLTLLEGGVPPSDQSVQKAAKLLRLNETGITNTYEIALTILFLNRLGDRNDRELIQRLALRLVGGQTAQGGWDYGNPVYTKEETAQILSILKDLEHRTPEDLMKDPKSGAADFQRRRPLVILDPKIPGRRWDNSNTQFAVLGLLAARNHGVPLDRSLALVNKHFRTTQVPQTGHWGYGGPGEISPILPGVGHLPTMTCAGLLGVAVGFSLQKADGPKGIKPEEDPVVKKALEHLAKFIGEPGKLAPGAKPPLLEMYFMWSVERVAVLYQLKTINGKKWYHWGVEMIVANQNPDGSWKSNGHGSTLVVDTCFAILFLQRSNLAKDLTDKLNELRGAPRVAAGNQPARKE
jgi:hypothetical protein